MKFRSPMLIFLIGSILFLADERSTYAQQEDRFVVVPREIGLLTVAYQPDCPLEFENARLLAGVGGGAVKSYSLRNRGNKSIRKVDIGDSQGNRWTWIADSKDQPVGHGELIPSWSGNNAGEVVPLTKELCEKLKLKGPMKGFIVLMVIRAEFTDGTAFDDEAVYTALRAYLDDLEKKIHRLQYLEQQQR